MKCEKCADTIEQQAAEIERLTHELLVVNMKRVREILDNHSVPAGVLYQPLVKNDDEH